MPGESLSFPIFAPDHASKNIREVGDAAAATAAKLDIAAVSAKLWNDTTIKSGKAAATAEAAVRSHIKADQLWTDTLRVLDGKATVTTKLITDQGTAFDKAGKSAKAAAGAGAATGLSALIGGGGGGGGAAGGGMAGLIAAGVALSPVIVTLGTGLAGFGTAAFAAAAPILKAAQATGGLAANMKTLDPEQQKVAQGVLGLGQQFGVFEKQLQPQVLRVFNEGIKLAGNLLGDVAPVAKATGTALGGLLGAVDKEFRSQTWQQFFSFMAKTAGPDIRLLQGAFIALLDALPPLIQGLQPVATALLTITKDGSQALDILTHFPGVVTGSGLALDTFHTKAATASGSIHLFSGSTGAAVTAASRGNGPMIAFGHTLGFISTLSKGAHLWLGLATGKIKDSGQAAAIAGPKFFDLNKAVAALNTSMTTLVGNLLTLQGSELSWKQALQAAQAQVKTNTAGTEGNSKAALANKQAILASTQAAISFASQELATGKNIDGASRTVRAQIGFLQGLHDKSAFVRAELAALRREEELLNKQRINQTISVQGLGQWSVSQSLAPGAGHRRAAGGRVPGYGGGDRWPALLEGGEAIVPKHLTPAVAPFLKAHHVPGFAAGGLIPSYSGSPAMAPWVRTDDAATIRLIDQAVVSATLAGMRAAARQAQVFGGGLGGAGLRGLENLWMSAGGPGGGTAHVAAAIALAESGGNRFAVGPATPFGSAEGLWQILGQVVPGNIFDPFINAENAVKKYRDAGGFSPWVTFESGAYLRFMDNGGYLPPGVTVAVNKTGRPERVLPPGGSGGPLVQFGDVHIHDGTDTSLLQQRLSFAITAAGLGS